MIARLLAVAGLFALAGALIITWTRHREGYGLDDLLAGRRIASLTTFTPAAGPVIQGEEVSLLERLNRENTKLIEAVTPAVVSINTTKETEGWAIQRTLDYRGPRLQRRRYAQRGLGSGVIVSKEGHVVTNSHVVDKVDQIVVTTHDGVKSLAILVGADPDADIAVLKIQNPERHEYPCLPFANSDSVSVGEAIWAIGNPFGLSESVTQGIISHRARQLTDREPPRFQTDTVINPGNSGGPLVNTRGEIVGISASIYTGQQNVHVWHGVGFAIPSNEVKRAMQSIMQGGSLGGPVGYIGVGAENVPVAGSRTNEVELTRVAPGSPAEKAGLKEGDRVVRFSGWGISDATDFLKRINDFPVDESADIVVKRGGETLNLKVTVANREQALTAEERAAERRDLRESLGIEVRNLTDSTRSRRNLPADFIGIVVSGVEPGSEAERAAIQPGDVIATVNSVPIESVEQFFNLISSLKGKTFQMRVVRHGYPVDFDITL